MRAIFVLCCSLMAVMCVRAQSLSDDGESVESGCGVERWSIKDLSDSAARYINFNPVARNVGDLVLLPTLDPSSSMPRDTSEMHTYSVVCYLEQYKQESDGDVHLVIDDTADPTVMMIAEIPDSSCPDAIAGGHAKDFAAARISLINITGEPPDSSSFLYLDPAPLVVIKGVGYYDPPHGQTGKAPNNLEIHPVLSLQPYTPSAVAEQRPDMIPSAAMLHSTPVPFSSQVNIAYAIRPGGAAISIYNMLGEKVFEKELAASRSSGMLSVNTSQFRAGMYVVLLRGEGASVTEKIICVK